MGSLVSPMVANLYMEYFEQKALSTAPTPRLWQRYADDTFVIQKEIHKQDFLQHINSVDPAIQFTGEQQGGWCHPFLDTIVKPEAGGNLSIIVYRKPTHTDQYLQGNSHNHLSAKVSVNHTLTHRAQTICSNPELLHKEKAHLRKVLTQCKYPKWALDKVEKRFNKPSREVTDGANNQGTADTQPTTNEVKKPRVILLYLTHKVSVKVSKRSVGDMAYRPTSKVVIPSGTYWSPPRTKTPWSAKVEPYTGSNMVTFPVIMNI